MRRFKKPTIVTAVVLIFFMAVTLLIVVLPQLLGITVTIVKDDQMRPTYTNGSLLFVKNNRPEEIYVGEVITYYVNQGEQIKTRRVVAKEDDHHVFYTKGDAQEQMEMGLVNSRNLIGQPLLHLPYLGHFVSSSMINLMTFLFWIAASVLTLMTTWLMVQQVAKNKHSRIRY